MTGDKELKNPELRKKYLAIATRSFKTKLDIYLFIQTINGRELSRDEAVITADFGGFKIDEKIRTIYKNAWTQTQIELEETSGLMIKKIDEKIDDWNKVNKNTPLLNQLRKQYVENFGDVLTVKCFVEVYKEKAEDRRCLYCQIPELEIKRLRDNHKLYTKRGRGSQLEIDRENFHEYETGKIVLSCYYCNNAKTDEFSIDEFKPVGKEIRKIWDNRLSKINSL
jgi:hypothetical protein